MSSNVANRTFVSVCGDVSIWIGGTSVYIVLKRYGDAHVYRATEYVLDMYQGSTHWDEFSW